MRIAGLNADFVTFFSGSNLYVDKEKELNGECDFIIVKDTDSPIIKNAILQITEAKEHDIKLGIPQCAAQLFNEKIMLELIVFMVVLQQEMIGCL